MASHTMAQCYLIREISRIRNACHGFSNRNWNVRLIFYLLRSNCVCIFDRFARLESRLVTELLITWNGTYKQVRKQVYIIAYVTLALQTPTHLLDFIRLTDNSLLFQRNYKILCNIFIFTEVELEFIFHISKPVFNGDHLSLSNRFMKNDLFVRHCHSVLGRWRSIFREDKKIGAFDQYVALFVLSEYC